MISNGFPGSIALLYVSHITVRAPGALRLRDVTREKVICLLRWICLVFEYLLCENGFYVCVHHACIVLAKLFVLVYYTFTFACDTLRGQAITISNWCRSMFRFVTLVTHFGILPVQIIR